ncbi:MAG: hypothetical protein HFH97_10120 [Lachnospiraceae bacterium]|nr:hypothetical protein [uncultured Acetatifactor sp.]MCI9572951.1 hypothetical protein [Lachnospiraceae bacterium]
MIELYYGSFDIACIIHSYDMGTKTASILLENIWKNDNLFLLPCYRSNLRKLYLDVYYWTDYLCDKPTIDKEFPSVQKDFEALGRGMEEAAFMTENFDMDLFFKMKRLQILYLEGQDYVRMKLRTMLKIYGYKRRTQELLRYFRECLMFYHMQTYLRGREECDVGEIGLDEMIIIRVI